MLCIQLRLESRSLQKKKPPPLKHVFFEMVIPQQCIGGLIECFKVYITKAVELKCVSPNKNEVRFTQIPLPQARRNRSGRSSQDPTNFSANLDCF